MEPNLKEHFFAEIKLISDMIMSLKQLLQQEKEAIESHSAKEIVAINSQKIPLLDQLDKSYRFFHENFQGDEQVFNIEAVKYKINLSDIEFQEIKAKWDIILNELASLKDLNQISGQVIQFNIEQIDKTIATLTNAPTDEKTYDAHGVKERITKSTGSIKV